MLDSLATRYHLLPSQVVVLADSLDMMVFDVATSYHRWCQQQAEKTASHSQITPDLSVNTMQDMINRVRKK